MGNIQKAVKNVHSQISFEEREEIACNLEKGLKQKEIAELLGRSPSTISREIARNSSPVRNTKYRANRAQLRSDERKRLSHMKVRLKNDPIKNYVRNKLKEGYTPEQIAGRISINHPDLKTNYESIYLYIYKEAPELVEYLVRGKRKRQKRSIKSGKRMVKIPNRVMISERPETINNKTEYGHWEADTVVSRQSKAALVVVRERMLQIVIIRKIQRKTARLMRRAVVRMLKKYPEHMRKSITFDNGLENAEHEKMKKPLGVDTYFCNAYHSWEKGGVENIIGLIRRFFPKKTNFELIKNSQIKKVESILNNRPRKTLGFKTPNEVYKNCA